jgi:hypothetical protein
MEEQETTQLAKNPTWKQDEQEECWTGTAQPQTVVGREKKK